jgi:hypothetical protein
MNYKVGPRTASRWLQIYLSLEKEADHSHFRERIQQFQESGFGGLEAPEQQPRTLGENEPLMGWSAFNIRELYSMRASTAKDRLLTGTGISPSAMTARRVVPDASDHRKNRLEILLKDGEWTTDQLIRLLWNTHRLGGSAWPKTTYKAPTKEGRDAHQAG